MAPWVPLIGSFQVAGSPAHMRARSPGDLGRVTCRFWGPLWLCPLRELLFPPWLPWLPHCSLGPHAGGMVVSYPRLCSPVWGQLLSGGMPYKGKFAWCHSFPPSVDACSVSVCFRLCLVPSGGWRLYLSRGCRWRVGLTS